MLVTAFNCRSINNWRPMLDSLIARGHAVYTALFPFMSDPDHKGLFDLPYPNLLTARLGPKFQPVDGDLRGVLNTLRQAVTGYGIDLVWMTTFHAGPEQHIREALRDLDRRPVTIGLQHGMQHDWSVFEEFADKFDLFGTFGPHFYPNCSERFRLRMITCGLPKLDNIPRIERSGKIRRILFAAQNQPPFEILKPFLHELSSMAEAEIIIRPHPQWRDLYRGLSNEFVLDSVDKPITESLREVDAVITTGSTAGLESLAMGLPTVVLPLCGGEVYETAGIVATRLDPNEVIALFRRFDDPDFNARYRQFPGFRCWAEGNANESRRRADRAGSELDEPDASAHRKPEPVPRLKRGLLALVRDHLAVIRQASRRGQFNVPLSFVTEPQRGGDRVAQRVVG